MGLLVGSQPLLLHNKLGLVFLSTLQGDMERMGSKKHGHCTQQAPDYQAGGMRAEAELHRDGGAQQGIGCTCKR
jgi:hypothetical protein